MGTIPPKKGQLQAIIPRRTTRTGKLAELSKDEDPIPGLTNDLTTRIFIEGHSGWQCTPPGCLVACVSVNSQGEVSQTFRVITSAPLRSQPHQSGYSGFWAPNLYHNPRRPGFIPGLRVWCAFCCLLDTRGLSELSCSPLDTVSPSQAKPDVLVHIALQILGGSEVDENIKVFKPRTNLEPPV